MASDQIAEKVKAQILARRESFKDQRIPFKSVGKAAAKKYLRKLIKLTADLRDHLHDMPLEARETGVLFPGDLETFGIELVDKLAWPAIEAIKIIEKTPGRKGNRENRSAQYAAWLIAKTYEEVAGIPPTVEEEKGLLEDLLPKLGINANPEHCARVRRREMKKETMQKK
jgi:hypothetical protein